MLMEEHKLKQQASALDLLTRYNDEGDNFLSCVVMGQVSHATPESKQQSMEWRHMSSPTKTKFKQTTSTRKIICTVFWDRKGILLVNFLPQGSTINAGSIVTHHHHHHHHHFPFIHFRVHVEIVKCNHIKKT